VDVASCGAGPIYIVITTEGLLRKGYSREYDRQLEVRRRWYARDGRRLDPGGRRLVPDGRRSGGKLRVGDLILVELTLRTPGRDSRPVQNIAVVDALPGGMEVEHPRLVTSARVPGPADRAGRGESRADRVEFLDDRVVLFATADGRKRTFRYALRVTTPGVFALPPVQASCMYDVRFASVHGAGRVRIRE
jgi:uncharacterized protein YfaS (alpha-2-macroglobulin family)